MVKNILQWHSCESRQILRKIKIIVTLQYKGIEFWKDQSSIQFAFFRHIKCGLKMCFLAIKNPSVFYRLPDITCAHYFVSHTLFTGLEQSYDHSYTPNSPGATFIKERLIEVVNVQLNFGKCHSDEVISTSPLFCWLHNMFCHWFGDDFQRFTNLMTIGEEAEPSPYTKYYCWKWPGLISQDRSIKFKALSVIDDTESV